MPDEHAELQERLAEAGEELDLGFNRTPPQKKREDNEPLKDWAKVNACQWAIAANDTFYACGGTKDKLPSGVYRLLVTNTGLLFSKAPLLTDKLIDLKDTASKEVIDGIKTFWAREHEFKKRGIIYKRGVLCWGAPGVGKTVAIAMLMKELVDKHNGIVILCDSPAVTVAALHQLRRIEPDRKLIVVLEDIDEILRAHGEHDLLALLDGESQISNVVFLACPAPETKILKADLTWCRADELKVDDEIVAFDEFGKKTNSGKLKARRTRTAKVTACPIIYKQRYKVTLVDGTVVTVSETHPFLTRTSPVKAAIWKTVEELKKGDKVLSIGKPWATETSRESGYLAGQFDVEGWLQLGNNPNTGGRILRMGWTQAIGKVDARVEETIKSFGFEVKRHKMKAVPGAVGLGVGIKGPHKPRTALMLVGGKWDVLRFLGSIRPYRLLQHENFKQCWEGSRIQTKAVEVEKIEKEHGLGPVVALGTTTRTFIGEGLLQHNTSNYPENLGARIVNRPSRFDEVRKISMPNNIAREIYLKAVAEEDIGADLPKWVTDTEDMSIAHLRELVVAVFCMQQPYDTVIERLKKMHIQPKPDKEFGIGGSGAGFTIPMRIKWN